MQGMMQYGEQIAWVVVILVGAVLAGAIVNYLVFKILRRVSEKSAAVREGIFGKHCREAGRWTLIVIAIYLVLPAVETFGITGRYVGGVKHILSLLFIGVVSWLVIKSTYVLDDYIFSRFNIDVKDNLRARKVRTQLNVIKRIVIIVVCILAVGIMLMTFEKVRQLGTTILASAGIIGVVVGMAAQRTIGTFIAGLQIAFTQPIRIDDVVIVENEWGRIEEISLTYVVVKIWDLRRLVVPITYFIEKPFQNWTRVRADVLGTVYIYADYTLPVEAVRAELGRILKNSDLWDGKVCGLQVTNASERTVELRALMSAADASQAWNLRCEVREKLIEFVQKKYPEALPKVRAEFEKRQEE